MGGGYNFIINVNAVRCPPRPSRARSVLISWGEVAQESPRQEQARHGTRSESWSQESVALRAGAVDVMGGSCAESPDNQSRAVVINACTHSIHDTYITHHIHYVYDVCIYIIFIHIIYSVLSKPAPKRPPLLVTGAHWAYLGLLGSNLSALLGDGAGAALATLGTSRTS